MPVHRSEPGPFLLDEIIAAIGADPSRIVVDSSRVSVELPDEEDGPRTVQFDLLEIQDFLVSFLQGRRGDSGSVRKRRRALELFGAHVDESSGRPSPQETLS